MLVKDKERKTRQDIVQKTEFSMGYVQRILTIYAPQYLDFETTLTKGPKVYYDIVMTLRCDKQVRLYLQSV